MRQQSSDHSTPSEANSSRREQMDKKRKIRKGRTHAASSATHSELYDIDTSKLSREEKAKLQRAKNREAAQRSRDEHRQYVIDLEAEVQQLREFKAASGNRLCWRCQKELDSSTHPCESSSLDSQQPVMADSYHQKEQVNLIDEYAPLPVNNHSIFGDDSYLRLDEGQDHSMLNFGLFVCMVVIAALWINSSPAPMAAPSRALMEIPSVEDNNSNSTNSTQIVSQESQQTTAIMPIENGLIALNSDCIKSLMIQGQATLPIEPKRSLTTFQDSPGPVERGNYLSNQQSILLCSVRTPKPYPTHTYDSYRSPLVRLYLLGSQIKDMITSSHLLLPIVDSNIRSNSLYKIAAQIKDVSLVNDHNCLL